MAENRQTQPPRAGSPEPQPVKDRSQRSIQQSRAARNSRESTGPDQRHPAGDRPQHPNGAAAILMIGVVLLLVLIALFSTFGGR